MIRRSLPLRIGSARLLRRKTSASSSISIISYKKLAAGCSSEHDRLSAALSDIGFFYVGDYEDALPATLVKQMRSYSDALFGAEEKEKLGIHLSKSPHFRGWSGLNEEVTLGVPDYKETFDFGYDQAPMAAQEARQCTGDSAWRNMRGPNQYLGSMRATSFQTDMRRYMDGVSLIGRTVLNGAARCLGRDPACLDRFFSDPFCILRFIKYPPVPAAAEADTSPTVGIGAHSDYGFLTLINQDPLVNGLQALTRTGDWVSVNPLPGTFAVNIGDMCEAWSGGAFRSTPHRVINNAAARGEGAGKARVSMAFFYEPALEATLDDSMLHLTHNGTDPLSLYGQHLHRAYTRSYPDAANTQP